MNALLDCFFMWRHHKDFAETRECGHPALVLKGGGWVRFFCSRMPHRTGEHFYDQTRDILNVDPRPSAPASDARAPMPI